MIPDKSVSIRVIYNEKEAAHYVGLSVKTLQARRFRHEAPAYIKAGRSIRYDQKDLDAFLAACRVDPEARN